MTCCRVTCKTHPCGKLQNCHSHGGGHSLPPPASGRKPGEGRQEDSQEWWDWGQGKIMALASNSLKTRGVGRGGRAAHTHGVRRGSRGPFPRSLGVPGAPAGRAASSCSPHRCGGRSASCESPEILAVPAVHGLLPARGAEALVMAPPVWSPGEVEGAGQLPGLGVAGGVLRPSPAPGLAEGSEGRGRERGAELAALGAVA